MSEAAFLQRFAEELLTEAERLAVVRAHAYGFRFGPQGIEVVPEEARVIQDVLTQLATIKFMSCARILELIAQEYRAADIRNRSHQPFTSKKLAKLCNPLVAGLQPNRFGILVSVANYPAIIDAKTFKAAHARLLREGLLE
jgi:hypothetical protein